MDKKFLKTNQDKALCTMQELELEGLKEIDRICRKHGIQYSLGGGTCLGQLRHGGFIPWDDDIDVDMTLENYNRFMEVVFDELDTNRFFLRCRKTDPTHYRSASRLEILGTQLSIPRWDSAHKQGRVFVDIFRWNYLPDDEAERRKVATRLFLVHCIQTYKEYGKYAKMLTKRQHLPVRICAALVPKKMLENYEEKLCDCTHGEKTGWIIDDAIIHGDHGGYPSEGVDDYEDTTFEGIRVMNKKNSHNFLKTIYGEHYAEWLPPAKRISHHAWTLIDFGEFDEKYHLDPVYRETLSVKHTPSKLRQMKRVSDEMVEDFKTVCEKHHLQYAIADAAPEPEKEYLEEAVDLWAGAAILMMPRKDYDALGDALRAEFPEKYFYQTHETDPEYFNHHARIRLNLTKIREKKVPARKEELYHNGFYIKVVPFDPITENEEEQKEYLRKIRRLRKILLAKRKLNGVKSFRKMSLKQKGALFVYRKQSEEDLYREIDALMHQYENAETSLCFDSSFQLHHIILPKEEVGGGRALPLLQGGPMYSSTVERFVKKVSRRFGPCYLTYYDNPDNQLSVLRYDEKEDRFLSTEEILHQACPAKES